MSAFVFDVMIIPVIYCLVRAILPLTMSIPFIRFIPSFFVGHTRLILLEKRSLSPFDTIFSTHPLWSCPKVVPTQISATSLFYVFLPHDHDQLW